MANEKKIHFNIIDILIILGFVIIIAGFSFYASGVWQTNPGNDASVAQNRVRYVLYAENVRPEIANSISVGDELKDAGKSLTKGCVVEIISNEPYIDKESYNEETGEFVSTEHPKNRTVKFVVESGYTDNNGVIMIDDLEIKVGKAEYFKSTKYVIRATILDVENK